MNNSGTLVDRRLEAGHGDKVAIRCAGRDGHLRAAARPHLPRGQRARRARRRPRGPRADDPRRHADVPGAVPGRDAHAAPCPRRSPSSTPPTTSRHYARDSYAKLIVRRGRAARAPPARARWPRSEFERLLAQRPGETQPRRHPPRRHGVLAVQRRLDRLPEGRRAPAPRHPVHVRDVRARDPADHRERRHVLLDQALPRVRAGQQPHVPVLGGRDDGAAARAGPTRAACWRPRRSTGRACSSASRRSTARWSTCPTPPTHDLSSVRMCVSAAEPLAPEVLRRWQAASASTSSTASARPRCCTSTAPTGRATSARARAASPCRATSWRCSTSTAQPVADGEVGNLHVRGDSALAYYWHQHEKTKAAIKGDCSSPATATASTTTATTSTRAAPTT